MEPALETRGAADRRCPPLDKCVRGQEALRIKWILGTDLRHRGGFEPELATFSRPASPRGVGKPTLVLGITGSRQGNLHELDPLDGGRAWRLAHRFNIRPGISCQPDSLQGRRSSRPCCRPVGTSRSYTKGMTGSRTLCPASPPTGSLGSPGPRRFFCKGERRGLFLRDGHGGGDSARLGLTP